MPLESEDLISHSVNSTIEYYFSFFCQSLIDVIATTQNCDRLRFEFPNVFGVNKVKARSIVMDDYEKIDSCLFITDENRISYRKIVVENGAILIWFAHNSSSFDKPKRTFSFVGTLQQLKTVLKPYYKLFESSTIMIHNSSNDDEIPVFAKPRELDQNVPKTNVFEKRLNEFLMRKKLMDEFEFNQITELMNSISSMETNAST